MCDQLVRVQKARTNIVGFEEWVSSQQILRRVSGGEHREHVLHREASAANDRLAAEDRGIGCDPLDKVSLSHTSPIIAPAINSATSFPRPAYFRTAAGVS